MEDLAHAILEIGFKKALPCLFVADKVILFDEHTENRPYTIVSENSV